ncbi:tetratricopeptide repeat protein [Parahaliea mediterranea]|uniref:Tetratricopeptide repeat protein n=1 Tax=Parahaliea mediterranea TaxID=651086 RepID=A0A939II55_9GAMM|nr:tetratricopeptide repeat protein [Parahaliea mediterranea]MBN7796229.1 tetratricopeptide repeat protein [Parahaliea mediterranea]
MDARQFIAELKSRGVYRVAALYCAGAWALLQVADVFSPMLGLPDNAVTLVLLATAIGFPVALLLAWRFDLTARGVVAAPPTVTPSRRMNLPLPFVLELLLILALTLSVGYLYLDRLTPGQVAEGGRAGGVQQGRPSVAVMPFLNMSSGEDMDYLGDGLAEEILNLLSRLSELNVAARTASFYFRDKDVDLRDIAERLGVGHVLEGSVRRDGSHVRVTAQLVETASGFQVWSAAYDRDMGGLLALQEDIARSVVESLQVVLSEQSSQLLTREYEIEAVSYDYYLHGRDYLRKQMDESNLSAAVSFFRRALEVSTDFADAWAGLCDGLLKQYEINRRSADFLEGESACQRALELDKEAVSVYIALGNLYRVSGKYGRALDAFNNALSLNPAAVDAYRGRGNTFAAMNQPSQVESDLTTAVELQPNFWGAYNDLAAYYFESGQFERAIPLLQRVASLNPDSETAWNNLGSAFYMIGEPGQAAQAWERSVAQAPTAISLSNLGGSLFFAGKIHEAADKYEQAVQLAPENFEYWGYLGETLQLIPGRRNEAQSALERAIDLGNSRLAINPNDALARAMVASYLARLGRAAEAVRLLDDSLESGERSMYELYDRAVAFTVLGRMGEAVSALESAVELGYPVALLSLDRNFADLRREPRFATLVRGTDPLPAAATFKEIGNGKYP